MPSRYFLDWIACTWHGNPVSLGSAQEALNTHLPLLDVKWTYAQPLNGYLDAVQTQGGALLSARPERMGMHLDLSGSALASLCNTDVTNEYILHGLRAIPAKFGRLDVAIDAVDSKLDIHKLRTEFRANRAVSHVRLWRLQESAHDGLTFYVGSPQSDRQLRIYNKAAERRANADLPDNDDWIRIELQLRHEAADAAVDTLERAADFPTGIRNLILAFVDFPTDHKWVSVTHGQAMAVTPSVKQRGQVRKWLLSAVVPALAREIAADPDFKRVFERAVSAALLASETGGDLVLDRWENVG